MDPYFGIKAVSNSFLGERKRELLGLPPMNGNSQALRKGTTAHKLLLERDKFNVFDYRGRERYDAMKLCNSVDEKCPPGFFHGDKEKAFEYDFMGWKCKMKVDIISDEFKVVTDFKTTAAPDEIQFLGSVLEYGYDRQAAWYLDAPPVVAMDINIFRIIAVCKMDPFNCYIYTLHRDDARIEGGREDYLSILSYLDDDPRFQSLKSNSKSC